MFKNNSNDQYLKHHKEFEVWFAKIHPYAESAHWIDGYDVGYYSESMTQGAWIAWLELTGKNGSVSVECGFLTEDEKELITQAKRLYERNQAISEEIDNLLEKALPSVSKYDLAELNDLVDVLPPSFFRTEMRTIINLRQG